MTGWPKRRDAGIFSRRSLAPRAIRGHALFADLAVRCLFHLRCRQRFAVLKLPDFVDSEEACTNAHLVGLIAFLQLRPHPGVGVKLEYLIGWQNRAECLL